MVVISLQKKSAVIVEKEIAKTVAKEAIESTVAKTFAAPNTVLSRNSRNREDSLMALLLMKYPPSFEALAEPRLLQEMYPQP